MIIDKPQAEDLPGLRQLWKQAFGDSDAFLDSFFSLGFSRERCRCLHTAGQLAAALYWFDCSWQNKKVAYIYAVATDKALQGRGMCRTLMADTHRHLQERGYAGAALVPGNKSLFSLYEKYSYRSFCPMETVTVTAGAAPLSVATLTPEEFDTLRQNRLPENAISQQGQTTAFLATFADLCKAGNAVFAVSREKDTLHFQEYLGDTALLPGIVAALRAEKGIVRLPGGNLHSAMYLSLDNHTQLPAYLGIPLN